MTKQPTYGSRAYGAKKDDAKLPIGTALQFTTRGPKNEALPNFLSYNVLTMFYSAEDGFGIDDIREAKPICPCGKEVVVVDELVSPPLRTASGVAPKQKTPITRLHFMCPDYHREWKTLMAMKNTTADKESNTKETSDPDMQSALEMALGMDIEKPTVDDFEMEEDDIETENSTTKMFRIGSITKTVNKKSKETPKFGDWGCGFKMTWLDASKPPKIFLIDMQNGSACLNITIFARLCFTHMRCRTRITFIGETCKDSCSSECTAIKFTPDMKSVSWEMTSDALSKLIQVSKLSLDTRKEWFINFVTKWKLVASKEDAFILLENIEIPEEKTDLELIGLNTNLRRRLMKSMKTQKMGVVGKFSPMKGLQDSD